MQSQLSIHYKPNPALVYTTEPSICSSLLVFNKVTKQQWIHYIVQGLFSLLLSSKALPIVYCL